MTAAVQSYLTNYGTTGFNPSEDTTGIPENWALQQGGVKMRYAQQTIKPNSVTDSSLSTYLLMKDIPSDAILLRCDLEVDTNTDAIYANIGLYVSGQTGGTVVATYGQSAGVPYTSGVAGSYCYYGGASGTDLTSATTPAYSSMLDGCANLTHANRLQPTYYNAGDTLLKKPGSYDLVFEAVSGISTAASITAHMQIIDNG
jgi:hypothetical protein